MHASARTAGGPLSTKATLTHPRADARATPHAMHVLQGSMSPLAKPDPTLLLLAINPSAPSPRTRKRRWPRGGKSLWEPA